MGFGEVGISEVGFGEMGIGKVGCGEMGIGKVGFGEVGFGKVGENRSHHQKRLRATDVLCYLIIISSQLAFINTSLIKQTKNMIVCYQNNIENKVCHN